MTTPENLQKTFDATQTQIMDLSQRVGNTPHVFIGITFKDSSGNSVTPSGGTYTIEVRPVGMEDYQPIVDGTDIDATAVLVPLDFAINAQSLRYTPNAVTGAAQIQITVSGNLS